jgi:CDP-glycerol glycerophosphotransferase (TagB/SpsB family)
VFHGFDSGKKNKFNIRGFFDLYCTQGPNITKAFNHIADGTCEIVETGWSKLDPLFTLHPETQRYKSDKPIILYAPTFSPKLTSTEALYPYIKQLAASGKWQWLVKLHPKATSEEVSMYRELASENLCYVETGDIIPLLQASDVILSDTSSILAEFALQNKVVIAFNNRRPEPWMINFQDSAKLEEMLKLALEGGEDILHNIKNHAQSIHPYQDGISSERVLNAIEVLVDKGTDHLKAKPINLVRRLKMRKKLKYFHWK